jgi:hypothetical protein
MSVRDRRGFKARHRRQRGLSAGGKDLLIMGAVLVALWIVGMSVEAHGQEIPRKTFDAKYWTATVVTAGIVYADAYSTTYASPVCGWETSAKGNAWLYGAHPAAHPVRAYAVMSTELASAMTASYLLKRHHSRLWTVPLGFIAFNHGEGVAHNVRQGCF